MNWWKGLRGKVRINEPLKDKTTFKIGGRAKFFIEPKDQADLKLLIKLTQRYKIPVLIIGSGSNILVNDRPIKAVVLQLNAPCFRKLSVKKDYIEAGGGISLSRLIQVARMRRLSGLEFLAGIPGRLGGALAMNAGVWGKTIACAVEKVNVMDFHGNVKDLEKKDIKFGYRKSSLEKYIILSALLKLDKRSKGQIEGDIKRFLEQRRIRQDKGFPNAGCIFKNPKGESAGRLIEQCGLKGKRIGGACISQRHANFIINRDNASCGDVLRLMDLVNRKVRNKFNITLEPEIKIWK